jgi:hypothetical protein
VQWTQPFKLTMRVYSRRLLDEQGNGEYTEYAVTWLPTSKFRFACWAGSIVPVADTVWRIVSKLAVANRGESSSAIPALPTKR